ncbi:MAG: alpha/beta fold hydrolase [Acidobacteria bacterium]|nr:alpha/beta fold hydrolase [Acidobacteriota bacterium]
MRSDSHSSGFSQELPVQILEGAAKSTPKRPIWVSEEAFPFTSRWLQVDGANLHFVDEGEGPVLLMVPGSPLWSFMYREPIKALRKEFRCIAVDLPGLGLSEAPMERGKAFSRNADWLHGFVQALDLRDFTLVVHATAGPSALEMATRIGDRIRRLVISNTFAWPLDEYPMMSRFVKIVSSRAFGFVNVRFNLLPRILTRFGRQTGRFSVTEKAAVGGPFRKHEARLHLQNLLLGLRAERDLFRSLEGRLSVFRSTPTLFLYGAHDNGYKAGFLERWQRLLPNCRAVVLPNSNHFPLEDEPQAFTAALQEWLWATQAASPKSRVLRSRGLSREA